MTAALTTTIMIPLIMLTLSQWLPQTTPDQEKLSPYECGFSPLENARLPFSLHFFLTAIFFLLFDLEIALLLPLPWALNAAHPMTTMYWTLLILILLTAGLAYEWNEGALDWTQ
uniref:NADH-ubiquinone oxidoreductase chain 3 n=1 Tax=Acanthosaura armata TaxID=285987 RepID=D6RR88_9SAUR|nr:NADH dehydrogenase subunit 3 [Acanthosaura armata]